MTAIVAVNYNWSIKSCNIAPRDLNYERNTEKYGRAMKLTIASQLLILTGGLFLHFQFYPCVLTDLVIPKNRYELYTLILLIPFRMLVQHAFYVYYTLMM